MLEWHFALRAPALSCCAGTRRISIHALLAERDHCFKAAQLNSISFQSTRSLRSATMIHKQLKEEQKHFNPRAPCGARLALAGSSGDGVPISIHALLAERDIRPPMRNSRSRHFNPRAPCGARPCRAVSKCAFALFQSTRSLRSATQLVRHLTLPLCISIHALLAERDFARQFPLCKIPLFQSTRSLRSATRAQLRRVVRICLISIHALLAERDETEMYVHDDFLISIHALLAERDRTMAETSRPLSIFQSTRSLRSATLP